MEYLGDKLSVAHSQVSGWMGNVRRSLQGALNLVSSGVERRSGGGEDGGGFKRAASLRSLASRSRESFRRFSLRSQQRLSLRRRTTSLASPSTPSSVRETICNFYSALLNIIISQTIHHPAQIQCSVVHMLISPQHHVALNLCLSGHFPFKQNWPIAFVIVLTWNGTFFSSCFKLYRMGNSCPGGRLSCRV